MSINTSPLDQKISKWYGITQNSCKYLTDDPNQQI